MNPDRALISVANQIPFKNHRPDRAAQAFAWTFTETWMWAAVAGLALAFVTVGAENLDIGPTEARLGLATGERLGPLGAVVGNWAPDLWPVPVWIGRFFAKFESGGLPSSSSVRWPSAIAAMIAGGILVRGMSRTLGTRAGLFLALAWFGCLALIDRSLNTGIDFALGFSSSGLDFVMGLAIVVAINRLLTQGSDAVAGLYASVAFLSGGWPPLVVIALAIIVIGNRNARYSPALLLPPAITAILWSIWTIRAADSQVWTSALSQPLSQRPDWGLSLAILALGLPWSPFALIAFSRSLRERWTSSGKQWLTGWCQVMFACIVAGTVVPGLSQAARVPALVGLSIVVAACLDSVWMDNLSRPARRTFFVVFSTIVALWLTIMFAQCFLWNLVMPFYRSLGVVMSVAALVVAGLTWSTLESANSRRGLITMVIIAVSLKVVSWGYTVPEWNYRHSQGPWARAIAQWVPPRWTLYTFHDWPEDLMFFTRRRVRQLDSPQHLQYAPGETSKYVLLQAQELEYWPETAPELTVVARFQDRWCRERVLARTTQGNLPPGYRSGLVGPTTAEADGMSSSEPE